MDPTVGAFANHKQAHIAREYIERLESAADVMTALDGIDLSAPNRGEVRDEAKTHALGSLAGGVFVGRQREMGELKAALEDAPAGPSDLIPAVVLSIAGLP